MIKRIKNILIWLGSGVRRWIIVIGCLYTIISYKQVDDINNVVIYQDWRILLGVTILLGITVYGWYLYEKE